MTHIWDNPPTEADILYRKLLDRSMRWFRANHEMGFECGTLRFHMQTPFKNADGKPISVYVSHIGDGEIEINDGGVIHYDELHAGKFWPRNEERASRIVRRFGVTIGDTPNGFETGKNVSAFFARCSLKDYPATLNSFISCMIAFDALSDYEPE